MTRSGSPSDAKHTAQPAVARRVAKWRTGVPWGTAPALVGLVSLAATMVLVDATARLVNAQERAFFDNLVSSGVNAIEEGVKSDIASATVAAHLFASTGELDHRGFERFVRHLGRYQRAGLEQVGWCLRVEPTELPALSKRAARLGIEKFSIAPAGDRPEYCPILFLAKQDAALKTGLDLFAEPGFRHASRVARRSGTVSASTLTNSYDTPELTLVIPVYRSGHELQTGAQRNEAIRAFAFIKHASAGTAERVPRSVKEQTEVRLYPSTQTHLPANEEWSAGLFETPTFLARAIVRLGDSDWVAEFKSTEEFEKKSDRAVVKIALIAGIMVSLLLVAVTGAEARARVRAVKAGLRLAESEEELRKASEAKDQFLAVVSHELRNPLGAIASALQVLRLKRSGQALLPAERRALDAADRQVRHQTRLIDDLLDASRLSAGKLALQEQYLDVNEVVRRSAALVAPAIREREQQVNVITPDEPVVVKGDQVRLEQVFGNLLTNASKYTPAERDVTISVTVEGERALIRVSDEGIGLDQQLLEEIFEPFFQKRQGTHPSEGLGLGLSVVRGLVFLHGGEVTAQSAGLNQGSRFTVSLPLVHHPASPIEEPRSAARATPIERPQRALVIDDMEDGREMLREFLDLLGYQVSEADSGRAALESLKHSTPDIALVDIGLPDIDGVALAERIRDTPGCEACRLIAVTGYGAARDRERAMNGAFEAYMVKPVDLQALVQLLKEEPIPRAAPHAARV